MTRSAPFALLFWSALASVAPGQDAKPKDDTLGLAPPDGAYYLFRGDLSNWVRQGDKKPATWPLEDGVLTVKGGNIQTRGHYRDFRLHVEFSVPLMPDKHGQARGNSGVYLGGLYELQVLDSYGLKPQSNDCGAIYQQVVPSVNACKPPLQWQTYDIAFRAARVKDGRVEKARLTVLHNGIKTIDDREISPTPGGVGGVKEGDRGPIMLQDHGNAVQYRNTWIEPLDP